MPSEENGLADQLEDLAFRVESRAAKHDCAGADCARCWPNGIGEELRAIVERLRRPRAARGPGVAPPSKMACAWAALTPFRDGVDVIAAAHELDALFDRVRRETIEDEPMLVKLRWLRDTVGVDIERMFARAQKEKDGREAAPSSPRAAPARREWVCVSCGETIDHRDTNCPACGGDSFREAHDGDHSARGFVWEKYKHGSDAEKQAGAVVGDHQEEQGRALSAMSSPQRRERAEASANGPSQEQAVGAAELSPCTAAHVVTSQRVFRSADGVGFRFEFCCREHSPTPFLEVEMTKDGSLRFAKDIADAAASSFTPTTTEKT